MFDAIVARIPGLPPPDPLVRAAQAGAFIDAESAVFLPALGLAATLPREDTEGFAVATALLLADRLQDGAGEDDLYWHYDAHAATYADLPADIRSAILMAFAILHDFGRVTLDAPPTPDARASRPGGLVRAALTSAPEAPAQILRAALDDGPLEDSEMLWRTDPRLVASSPALEGAARHLYLTRPDWDPYRDWSQERIATEGVALPFPSALPLPHGTP